MTVGTQKRLNDAFRGTTLLRSAWCVSGAAARRPRRRKHAARESVPTSTLNACGSGCSKSSNGTRRRGEPPAGRRVVCAGSWPGAAGHHTHTGWRAFGPPVRCQFAAEVEKIGGYGVRCGTLWWSRSWSKETLPQRPLVQSRCGRFFLSGYSTSVNLKSTFEMVSGWLRFW